MLKTETGKNGCGAHALLGKYAKARFHSIDYVAALLET